MYLDPNDASSFSPQHHFDTPEELLSRAYNRLRNAQLEGSMLENSTGASAELLDSRRLNRYARIQCRDHWLAMHEAVLQSLILSTKYVF